ncbi:MAG: hypothetical protein ACRDRA_16050 [Pseudonocardiaceae bacterium]
MTTFSVMIAALLGISVLCAQLGRTTVLLVLSYLALRRSQPDERKEILEALTPALSAVGSPDHPDVQRSWRDGPIPQPTPPLEPAGADRPAP